MASTLELPRRLPLSDGVVSENNRLALAIDALQAVLAAARAGCASDSPDWRYQPAWRRHLALAVRRHDEIAGIIPKEQPRNNGRGIQKIPERRPVATLSLKQEFAQFWEAYPRKMEGGPLAAEKAYVKARSRATAEEILTGVATYPFRSDPAYQPKAARWLDDGCWMITKDTAPRTTARERNGRRNEAAELAEEVGFDLITPIATQFPQGASDEFAERATDYIVAD